MLVINFCEHVNFSAIHPGCTDVEQGLCRGRANCLDLPIFEEEVVVPKHLECPSLGHCERCFANPADVDPVAACVAVHQSLNLSSFEVVLHQDLLELVGSQEDLHVGHQLLRLCARQSHRAAETVTQCWMPYRWSTRNQNENVGSQERPILRCSRPSCLCWWLQWSGVMDQSLLALGHEWRNRRFCLLRRCMGSPANTKGHCS